jgi:hypothetical protein
MLIGMSRDGVVWVHLLEEDAIALSLLLDQVKVVKEAFGAEEDKLFKELRTKLNRELGMELV